MRVAGTCGRGWRSFRGLLNHSAVAAEFPVMRLVLPPWLFWLDALFFVGLTAHFLWHLRWVHRLPLLDQLPALKTGTEPSVSVILAARDEAQRIERTVRGLLGQRNVRLQIVVSNDRSTDATGAILDRLVQEDSRVEVIHITELPPEWLGKCHACYRAARQATGDWLLFTDADCWLDPDAIHRALRVAERDGAQHVTLVPGVMPESLAAAGWHIGFTFFAANWISGVNRDQPRAHLGAGAFNLMRTELYHRAGGHEKLRLSVVDDVKLGLLLHRAGGRTRGFLGGRDAECHWGTTLRQGIRLMEKNFFAIADYQTGLVVGAVALIWTLWSVAFLGVLSGGVPGFLAFASMMLLVLPAWVVCRRLGWSTSAVWVAPFIIPVTHYALLRSMVLTLRRGGVRWRDTFYPLALLRSGNVR